MSIKNTRLLRRPRPRDDESLSGYLLRLSEANGYESLSWILQITKLKDYANGSYTFAYGGKKLASLSNLSCVPESDLEKLIYKPIDVPTKRFYGVYEIFGQRIYSYIIRHKTPKICPYCLAEDPYCRKVWDLIPVTACPIHNCLLMENCPNCDAKIIWNRKAVCYCRYCNWDWRQSVCNTASEDELRVVKYLYGQFDLAHGNHLPLPNVLFGLNIQDTLAAIFLILTQLQGATDTKGKILAGLFESNQQLHTELNRAVNVFEDFPNNFFTFLDFSKKQNRAKLQASMQVRKTKCITGWRLGFENFGAALFGQMNGEQFQFLHDAFRYYLYLHKLPLEIASDCTNRNIDEVVNNYLSVSQAAKILEIKISELRRIAPEKGLKIVFGERKDDNQYSFIDRKTVERLKDERLKDEKLKAASEDSLLLLNDAAKFLGLTTSKVKELWDEGLLQPIRFLKVNGKSTWVFNRTQMEEIYNAFAVSVYSINEHTKESGWISFISAITRLNRVGLTLKIFIQMVINGKLSPCSIGSGTGLSKFYFERQKIEQIYQQTFKEVTNSACTISEIAAKLGLSWSKMQLLSKTNLLPAKIINNFKALGMLITAEDFNNFENTYIFGHDIALKSGIRQHSVKALLAKRNVYPITEFQTKQIFVFRRSDTDGIILSEEPKVKKEPRVKKEPKVKREPRVKKEPKIKSEPRVKVQRIFTHIEAAEYLKINTEEFLSTPTEIG